MTARDPQPDDAAPDSLVADLTTLYGQQRPVPSDIDAAILATIRHRAATIRRMRLTIRWAGAAAAIAAMLLIAFHLWPAAKPVFQPGASVTILDAFSLARQLKTNAKPDASWDVNHDGVVDQKDVDFLATQAVSLHLTPKAGTQ